MNKTTCDQIKKYLDSEYRIPATICNVGKDQIIHFHCPKVWSWPKGDTKLDMYVKGKVMFDMINQITDLIRGSPGTIKDGVFITIENNGDCMVIKTNLERDSLSILKDSGCVLETKGSDTA